MKYCYHLGQCDEDYCDCENIVKMESEQTQRKEWELGLVFGLFIIGLFLAIIL